MDAKQDNSKVDALIVEQEGKVGNLKLDIKETQEHYKYVLSTLLTLDIGQERNNPGKLRTKINMLEVQLISQVEILKELSRHKARELLKVVD